MLDQGEPRAAVAPPDDDRSGGRLTAAAAGTWPATGMAMYHSGAGPHPHVHGANLGIRAPAYLAAGGFRPLPTAEDHALMTAATRYAR